MAWHAHSPRWRTPRRSAQARQPLPPPAPEQPHCRQQKFQSRSAACSISDAVIARSRVLFGRFLLGLASCGSSGSTATRVNLGSELDSSAANARGSARSRTHPAARTSPSCSEAGLRWSGARGGGRTGGADGDGARSGGGGGGKGPGEGGGRGGGGGRGDGGNGCGGGGGRGGGLGGMRMSRMGPSTASLMASCPRCSTWTPSHETSSEI